MTFTQQIFATFIGAFAAFIFSIALFYLTEKWKNSRINKDLSGNLQKELTFNITFLESFEDEIEKGLRQISADDKSVIIIWKFSQFQRLFIQEAFNKGLLYKHLRTEDITGVDAMLSFFTPAQDQLAIAQLQSYKIGQAEKAVTLRNFEYNRNKIQEYKKLCENNSDFYFISTDEEDIYNLKDNLGKKLNETPLRKPLWR